MITRSNPARLLPLLGVATTIAMALFASPSLAHAQAGYSVLHSFTGGSTDGANPFAGLIQSPDGTLYGTTTYGGTGDCLGLGCGTVFKLAADGSSYAVLHSFTGPDGTYPNAGLMQGPDGTLYGTTRYGGTGTCSGGCGTVFKLAPDGSGYGVLHSFIYAGTEGVNPDTALIQGPDATLYGTTFWGNGAGVVFRVAPDGSGFTVLHSFPGDGTDGGNPFASLTQRPDGTLYGTTSTGGTRGYASVFQMAPDGSGYAVVHSFTGPDGDNPEGSLLQGPDGTFYGTTSGGGISGIGTVFRMAPDGSGFTVLHSFTRSSTDGDTPFAALIQGPDGTLYGTTRYGGASGYGTIFQMAPDGSGFTVLHSFTGGTTDGANPHSALLQGPDGTLYGTTRYGGPSNGGVVFKLTSSPSAPKRK